MKATTSEFLVYFLKKANYALPIVYFVLNGCMGP